MEVGTTIGLGLIFTNSDGGPGTGGGISYVSTGTGTGTTGAGLVTLIVTLDTWVRPSESVTEPRS